MKKGDTVHWNWGASLAEGKVEAKHDKSLSKNIKGTAVKRNASKEEPAYTIKQGNGAMILKSASELRKGRK